MGLTMRERLPVRPSPLLQNRHSQDCRRTHDLSRSRNRGRSGERSDFSRHQARFAARRGMEKAKMCKRKLSHVSPRGKVARGLITLRSKQPDDLSLYRALTSDGLP